MSGNRVENQRLLPGRLWSLWDVLEVDAEPFVEAVSALSWMSSMIRVIGDREPSSRDEVMGAGSRPEFRKRLKALRKGCEAMTATNSEREARFLLRRLADEKLKWEEMQQLIDGLHRLLTGEIEGSKLYSLGLKSQYFGTVAEVFGAEAVVAFPAAEYDLEEAGKCLAVSRNTACVFHLMRAMETVVMAAGKKLKVTVIDKNDRDLEWGKLLANLADPIEKLPKGDQRTRWSAALTLLYHSKEAWRNPTMHPGLKYTDDEAMDVLVAVKAFIRTMATLAPDPGGVFGLGGRAGSEPPAPTR